MAILFQRVRSESSVSGGTQQILYVILQIDILSKRLCSVLGKCKSKYSGGNDVGLLNGSLDWKVRSSSTTHCI